MKALRCKRSLFNVYSRNAEKQYMQPYCPAYVAYYGERKEQQYCPSFLFDGLRQ